VRPLALAAIVFLLGTNSAAQARCFSVWRYPWPQHCHATALAPRSAIRITNARIDVALPALRHTAPAVEFSLPNLTDIEWGQPPDDELRGKLLLRVLLQAKESK
jgi:hypothetical protein